MWTFLEDVGPPRVGQIIPHVVRNHVQKQAQPEFIQPGRQSLPIHSTAEVRIDLIEATDVVTMRALRPRFEERRSVAIRDSKIAPVFDRVDGLHKRKVAVELTAIGGARNAPGGAHFADTSLCAHGLEALLLQVLHRELESLTQAQEMATPTLRVLIPF